MIDQIKHGDKVTILVPNGIGRNGQEWKKKTGTAWKPPGSGKLSRMSANGGNMIFKIIGVRTDRSQRTLIVSASIQRARGIVNDLRMFDTRFASYKIVRAQ